MSSCLSASLFVCQSTVPAYQVSRYICLHCIPNRPCGCLSAFLSASLSAYLPVCLSSAHSCSTTCSYQHSATCAAALQAVLVRVVVPSCRSHMRCQKENLNFDCAYTLHKHIQPYYTLRPKSCTYLPRLPRPQAHARQGCCDVSATQPAHLVLLLLLLMLHHRSWLCSK